MSLCIFLSPLNNNVCLWVSFCSPSPSLPASFAVILQQCRVQKLARFQKKKTLTHTLYCTQSDTFWNRLEEGQDPVSSKERLPWNVSLMSPCSCFSVGNCPQGANIMTAAQTQAWRSGDESDTCTFSAHSFTPRVQWEHFLHSWREQSFPTLRPQGESNSPSPCSAKAMPWMVK